MAKTWILVGHEAGARVFENRGPGKGLELVETIEHPEGRLRDRDIDTVVITGTLTNVCCESSVRDAFMRNFSVVIVADGNATYTDAIHNASMTSMAMTFGDVMTTDEVLGKLEPVRVAAE